MKKWIKSNFFLLAIILVAILLRFIKLGTIPIGFNDDEAAFGYNAYSILKTGRDEWGRFLPFPVFESFGDWKLVGYLYLTVISQFFFGVSEFVTRLPSAVFGVLAVWATYLLTKKLFENSDLKFEIGNYLKFDIPTIAALLLAISPWHIVASRNAFESDILIFFITISVYLFLKGLIKQRFLTLSFVGFAFCFYIYRSAWLFVPLFVSTLIYFYREKFRIIWPLLARNLILFFVLFLPLIPIVLTFKGQSRFFQESFILGVQRSGIIDEINARRGSCQSKLPEFICLSTYNKYSFFLSTYINNYFSNLSLETYYIRSNYTGYQSAPLRGFFYSFELPLLIIGLIALLKTRSNTAKQYIHYLLFEKYDPKIYQSSVVRYRDSDGWQVVEKIGKFSFYPSAPGLEILPANSLIAVEGTEAKELLFPAQPVFVVDDPKGDRLFEV